MLLAIVRGLFIPVLVYKKIWDTFAAYKTEDTVKVKDEETKI